MCVNLLDLLHQIWFKIQQEKCSKLGFFSSLFHHSIFIYLFRNVKKFDFFVYDVFECVDGEKGLTLAPFLSKFNSVKMVGKKGSIPIIDYKQIEKATGNFKESNILGEGGFGCVYKARLDDNLDVAIKKMNCENQYAEKEFEVMSANSLLIFVVSLDKIANKHHTNNITCSHLSSNSGVSVPCR